MERGWRFRRLAIRVVDVVGIGTELDVQNGWGWGLAVENEISCSLYCQEARASVTSEDSPEAQLRRTLNETLTHVVFK